MNLGYGFDGSFTRLKNFTFVSSSLSGEEHSGTAGNRFAGTLPGELPIPLPKQYLLGVDLQKYDFEDYGQPSYLRGKWKDGGWWYYYIYGLAVKTPHGTQFLLFLALLTIFFDSWKRRPIAHHRDGTQYATWCDLVILLGPALTILILVSIQLEFNHHVRYVLPILGFTFVFIGKVANHASSISKPSICRQKVDKNAHISSICRKMG